jgi:hypothetical protein
VDEELLALCQRAQQDMLTRNSCVEVAHARAKEIAINRPDFEIVPVQFTKVLLALVMHQTCAHFCFHDSEVFEGDRDVLSDSVQSELCQVRGQVFAYEGVGF